MTKRRTALPLRISPFTSSLGEKFKPSFSPDGTQIAFAWRGESEGQNHIYVKQIGNETVRQLTTETVPVSGEYAPVWSPDGRYIAYIKSTIGTCLVEIIPSLGGVPRRVSEYTSFYSGFLDWSPDGEWLVVDGNSADNKTMRLHLIAVKSGEIRQLTAPPAKMLGDLAAKFSPDGTTIAFSRATAQSSWDIYIVPITGGEPKRLTYNDVGQIYPLWAANGQELLYSGLHEGIAGTWRLPLTGGNPVQIQGIPNGFGRFPAISKQGDRLAFIESNEDSNIWQLELGTSNLTPKKLIYSTRSDNSPQISPDGNKIVFLSSRAGGGDLWMSDRNGQNAVQLTTTGGNGSPRWSPDGRQIVYDNIAKGTDIYAINVDGGSPRRLTDNPAEDMVPSWSQDGKWIYFCSSRSGSLQVWKMPAAGGTAIQVTKHGGFDNAESPDGKYLYYLKARTAPGIWRVPVAGGQEEEVFAHPKAGHRRYWAITNQGIYFMTSEQPSHPVLEFFSFATKRFTTLMMLDTPIYITMPGLSAAPDGRSLVWSQLDRHGSDIILIENFR